MSIRYLAAVLAAAVALVWQGPSHAAGTMVDLDGIKSVNTVWDITTGDEAKFNDRLGLIKQTADGFKKKGIEPHFVVLIHGGASKFVTKSVKGTKFEKAPIKDEMKVHGGLKSLTMEGIPVRMCGIAMSRTKIHSDNVVEYVDQVDNVFENLIALQAKGYAYMEVE